LEHLAGYAKKADELGSEMELDVRAMPINRGFPATEKSEPWLQLFSALASAS
jgi:hypothetical protein